MRSRIVLGLSSVAVVAALAGCAESKLTRRNYDMILEGKSTKMEVEKTLGENYIPRAPDQWEYEDEEHHLSVMIRFDDRGYVSGKEWRDAASGTWEGQAEGIDPNPPGRKVYQGDSTTTIRE